MQGAGVKQTRSVCSPRARAAAAGRSRCVLAKQIRGFSAQTFDSKRMRCLPNFSWTCLASANPRTAENRTLCRARALSKREAFVASGRGRRQAAEAGADLRSKYADSPRKLPTQNGCDVYRISAGLARHQRIPPNRGESNSMQGAGVKQTLRQRRVGHAFPTAVQAESSSRNPASSWDALSAPSPQLQNLCALHCKTG